MVDIRILNNDELSYLAIKEHLVKYVDTKPEYLKWKDFYESSAGQTVIELIAGSAAFKAHHCLMSRRESYLETAKLESSIYELAFNRGFMVAPADTLKVNIGLYTDVELVVSVDQEVAIHPDYSVFSLESKTLMAGQITYLDCCCGNLKIFDRDIHGIAKFTTFNFNLPETFVAKEMERLMIDGVTLRLVSDLNYLQDYGDDFLIRRVLPDQVKIYVANGKLGWYFNDSADMQYRCLTYGKSTFNDKSNFTSILPGVDVASSTVIQNPVFGMDKNEVKKTAMYYPLDGRIVQDSDYESSIMKYYGGLLKDVYSYNADTDQIVYLLKDSDTWNTFESLPQIKGLVDSKRAGGIKVVYHEVDQVSGSIITLDVIVSNNSVTPSLGMMVKSYLNDKLFKFHRSAVTLTTLDYSIELSAKFNIEFHPRVLYTNTYRPFDFIKRIVLRINNVEIK